MMNKKAFTLVELLIVVLIIGVLTAVALPQYQTAVNKSRYAGLMPLAKSVKDAEEAQLMATGKYTSKLEDLSVQVPGTIDPENTATTDHVTIELYDGEGNYDFVKAKDTRNPANTYVMYFAKSGNFKGEIHCEAKKDDPRAIQLCKSYGPAIGPIKGTAKNYEAYVLQGTGDGVGSAPGKEVVPGSSTSCVKHKAAAGCVLSLYDDDTYLEEYIVNGSTVLSFFYDENGNELFEITSPQNGVSVYNEYDTTTDPVLNQETNTSYELQYNSDGSLRAVHYSARSSNNYPYVDVYYSVYNGNVSLSQFRVIPDSSLQSIIYNASGTRIDGLNDDTYDQLVHDNIDSYKTTNVPTKETTLAKYCALSPTSVLCQ